MDIKPLGQKTGDFAIIDEQVRLYSYMRSTCEVRKAAPNAAYKFTEWGALQN